VPRAKLQDDGSLIRIEAQSTPGMGPDGDAVDGLHGHPSGIPPLRHRIDPSIGPDGYRHRRDQCTMEITGT